MSAPDQDRVGPLARRDGDAVFDEPWQAQALGMAFSLVDRGLFSAQDWSAALGTTLRQASADGAPDNPATYYGAVLATLEALTAAEGAVSGSAMAARREAWRQAYLRTPHGKPVVL